MAPETESAADEVFADEGAHGLDGEMEMESEESSEDSEARRERKAARKAAKALLKAQRKADKKEEKRARKEAKRSRRLERGEDVDIDEPEAQKPSERRKRAKSENSDEEFWASLGEAPSIKRGRGPRGGAMSSMDNMLEAQDFCDDSKAKLDNLFQDLKGGCRRKKAGKVDRDELLDIDAFDLGGEDWEPPAPEAVKEWQLDMERRRDEGCGCDDRTSFSLRERAESLRSLGPESFLGGRRPEQGGHLLYDDQGKINLHFLLASAAAVTSPRGSAASSGPSGHEKSHLRWILLRALELRLISKQEVKRGKVLAKRTLQAKKSGNYSLLSEANLVTERAAGAGNSTGGLPETFEQGGEQAMGLCFPERPGTTEARAQAIDESSNGGARTSVFSSLRVQAAQRKARIGARSSHNLDMNKVQEVLTAPSFSFDWEEQAAGADDGLEVDLPDAGRHESGRSILRDQLRRSVSFQQARGLLGSQLSKSVLSSDSLGSMPAASKDTTPSQPEPSQPDPSQPEEAADMVQSQLPKPTPVTEALGSSSTAASNGQPNKEEPLLSSIRSARLRLQERRKERVKAKEKDEEEKQEGEKERTEEVAKEAKQNEEEMQKEVENKREQKEEANEKKETTEQARKEEEEKDENEQGEESCKAEQTVSHNGTEALFLSPTLPFEPEEAVHQEQAASLSPTLPFEPDGAAPQQAISPTLPFEPSLPAPQLVMTESGPDPASKKSESWAEPGAQPEGSNELQEDAEENRSEAGLDDDEEAAPMEVETELSCRRRKEEREWLQHKRRLELKALASSRKRQETAARRRAEGQVLGSSAMTVEEQSRFKALVSNGHTEVQEVVLSTRAARIAAGMQNRKSFMAVLGNAKKGPASLGGAHRQALPGGA